jgi:hypothetical protein
MQKSYNSHTIVFISYISQSISTASVPFSLFWNPSLRPPAFNRDAVLSDPEFDRIDEVSETSLAEQEHVFSRPTGVVIVVDVGFPGSNEDAMARKAQEPIAAGLRS